MIDLYVEKSPAVYKVAIMLEECGLDYRLKHTSVSLGQQHDPAFRALSPNGKIPVLIDHDPVGGGAPLVIFESGAILLYLTEKTGKFFAKDVRQRMDIMQWLFWQSSGLSPMSGQAIHFLRYAPAEAKPYGQLRYNNEVRRLYGVLDQRLRNRGFICDDYSIADIGSYPWTRLHGSFGTNLDDFPDLKRWLQAMAERPAVERTYKRFDTELPAIPPPSPDFHRHLFGDAAAAVMKAH